MINVGIIGCGYWGPKHVRNFHELSEANLAIESAISGQEITCSNCGEKITSDDLFCTNCGAKRP